MNRVVVGLGSNLDPEENILMARFLIAKTFGLIKESSFRKTKPVNHPLADDFLNGCVYLQTPLDLALFRLELKKLEQEMGRDHQAQEHAPHPIDLDIVIWNEKIIDPHFYTRPFLKPMVLELLPGLKF